MSAPSADGFLPWPESPIWAMQRAYYTSAGVEAWRRGEVPHYVTTQPHLAHAYAQIVLAFLGDAVAGAGPVTWRQPLTIVEVGAGHGRFTYHFLTRFVELHRRSRWCRVPFRFVMADLSEGNVRAWQEHPRLAPFVEAGLLDFARFDAEADETLALAVSGERLAPRSLDAPLVVIANYLFDVLRQDLFRFGGDGRIERGVVRATREDGAVLESYDPEEGTLSLNLTYRFVETSPEVYRRPAWDALLHHYARTLEPRALLVPVAAMDLLERLDRLSRVGLLVLAADRGSDRLDELPPRAPGFGNHGGSFSLPVNFHAIEHVLSARGARVAQHRGGSLHFMSAVGPPLAGRAPDTWCAFDTFIARLDPSDFYLQSSLLRRLEPLGPEHALASLRLSLWDGAVFSALAPALVKRSPELDWPSRWRWREALAQVASAYFPLGEPNDVLFGLGALATALGFWRDALRYFGESAGYGGPSAALLHNAGLCHLRLGELDEAERQLEQAEAREPSESTRALLDEARRWRLEREKAALPAGLEPLGFTHLHRIEEALRESARDSWLARRLLGERAEETSVTPEELLAALSRAEGLIAHLHPEVGLFIISERDARGELEPRWRLAGTGQENEGLEEVRDGRHR